MDTLSTIDSMTWIIMISALVICMLVLFAKAINAVLKLAVIVVMLAFVAYFLRQAGII
ncbi:MAG: hypothetical protein KAU94_12190 [Verrucomicrobia bacterium]|nr:hypothetical protein [Verrucomicrobiota bacterium]